MGDAHAKKRLEVEQLVLRGPGHTEPSLRQALERGQAPPELAALVEKVRRHAYKVTDEDLAALKATWSDDQIFEIVVAAALGAAGDRLRAGLAALDGVD